MSKDSKAPIEEKDINNYVQVLEKINKRIGETYRTLPEDLPTRSVMGNSQLLMTPDKSATPFGGLTSGGATASGRGKMGGMTASPGAGLDFLKGILGGHDLI